MDVRATISLQASIYVHSGQDKYGNKCTMNSGEFMNYQNSS